MRKISDSLSRYIAISLYRYLVISSFISRIMPKAAYAQEPEEWASPRCVSPEGVATLQGFECIFRNIVRILTPIAGLALFIMLIVGSFQMMTAGGEAKKIQKARLTLTSAILGLVVFLGIWFILKLIQAITGVDVTRFVVPGP